MRSLLPPETAVLQGAFAAPLRLLLVPFMVLVCALQAQQEALMSWSSYHLAFKRTERVKDPKGLGGGWWLRCVSEAGGEWRLGAVSSRPWPGSLPCLFLNRTGRQHRGCRGDIAGPGGAGPQGG